MRARQLAKIFSEIPIWRFAWAGEQKMEWIRFDWRFFFLFFLSSLFFFFFPPPFFFLINEESVPREDRYASNLTSRDQLEQLYERDLSLLPLGSPGLPSACFFVAHRRNGIVPATSLIAEAN